MQATTSSKSLPKIYFEDFKDKKKPGIKLSVDQQVAITRKLRSLSHAFEKKNKHPLLNFNLDSSGLFEVTDKLPQRDIVVNLKSLFHTALEAQNYYFFDDNGKLVDLKTLYRASKSFFKIKGVKKKIKKSDILDSELLEMNHPKFLNSLPFPDDSHLKDKEQKCFIKLQRIHPDNSFETPRIFLFTYKDLVSTDELINVIYTVISTSKKYMPQLQKLRVVNFFRCMVGVYWIKDEIQNNQTVHKILQLINQKSKFFGIGKDIQLSLAEWVLSPLNAKPISLSPLFGSFISHGVVEPWRDSLRLIAHDLAVLSSWSICNLKFSDVTEQNDTKNATGKHYDLISALMGNLFSCLTLDGAAEKKNENSPFLSCIFAFCVALMQELVKVRDYFSSFIIYCCLMGIENKGILQLMQTDAGFSELALLFSSDTTFGNLRAKMDACKITGQYFIPAIHIIQMQGIAKIGFYKHQKKENGMENFSVLKSESNFLADFDYIFKQNYMFYRSNNTMHTDIFMIMKRIAGQVD